MKKTNLFKRYNSFIPKLSLVLLIGLLGSCQQEKEIIDLDDENIAMDLLVDTSQYKTYHKVFGKDGKVVGTLNDELEYVDENGSVTPKTSDTSESFGVAFYQHANFNGVKEVEYHGGHDLYLRNSFFAPELQTGITGVYVGPHCSVELYAQDQWVNKIRTIDGGTNGTAVHYLGNQNDQTRSAIVRCDFEARDRFLGFVHEHENYTGRSIPIFTRSGTFRPNSISGFTDVNITSVSLNHYRDYWDSPKSGVLITTPDDDEIPVIAHKETDVPHLRRLNDDRQLLLGWFPDLSMYQPNYDLQEAPKSNHEVNDFLQELKDNYTPMSQRTQVTKVELSNLCAEVRSECATANAKFESDGIVTGFVCATALSQVQTLMAAATTPTATQVAAIGSFRLLASGSGQAAGSAILAFVSANPVTATVLAAGVAGCIYAAHHAVKTPYLEDCREARQKCMDTYYYNTLNCTDC